MHARSGRLQVSPQRIDDIVGVMKEDQVATFHGQPGYRGFTGFADRESGLVMGISFWDTEDDLRAAEELGREARRRVMDTGGGQSEPVVERWEVVFDEMV
jgi:heme-degrading monooxygenase HmoA